MCCLDNQDSERIELVKKEKEFLNEKLIKLKPLMNYQETFHSVMSLEFSPAFICTGYTFKKVSRLGKTLPSKNSVME